ncbi:flap endonuclease-1 [archaeon]|nr:flap endonuclease-1 [archaeon]
MGVNLRDLFTRKEIKITDLSGKTIVIDGYNILYQFLTTIRTSDGALLTDSKGNVTSHLIGLFSRTSNFLQKGIKIVFVFDGEPPELKRQVLRKRKEAKIEAQKRFEEAKKEENIEEMKKYAARTARLTKDMVEEAKKLLTLMGVPWVQAPSEGEPQAAFMVKQGTGWAVSSQDYDSLLYGTPRLIQNLSIAGRRKKLKSLGTITVQPELIELKPNLEKLEINQDQLILLAMIVGTDYNPGGIKGLGPKKALKLVKEIKDPKKLFEEVKWNEHCEAEWEVVYNLFKKMPVQEKYSINFTKLQKEELIDFLVNKHDFNTERVKNTINELSKQQEKKAQKSLGDF